MFGVCEEFEDICNSNVSTQTNKMHKILVIRLYFSLDTLHVSDRISPPSGATFISYNHTTARRMVQAYTKCDVQLIKFAPDDGLI